MSHPYRRPSGTRPLVPGSMIPPLGTTGPPLVFPPPAYRFVTAPQQHFSCQPMVYPPHISGAQNRISVTAVPSNVPGMFIPVTRIPTGIRATTDPAKLLEEQRKLEKERNFQLQQQRLKQFTVAGKKGSMNADNLIDSMFGKVQPRKNSLGSSKVTNVNDDVKVSESAEVFQPVQLFPSNSEGKKKNDSNQNLVFVERNIPVLSQPHKDLKGLDTMMLECSNLAGPLKAKTFQKPSVNQLPPSSQQGSTFAASEKARDWKNIQGLDNVFTGLKPRLPSWCNKEAVPVLYHKIEAVVTNNGSHNPDTNLLFPILMSSGLSREALSHIWEVVNQSAPGYLIPEEMYAALALIAVAQAGHQIKSINILHQLPSCPIPQLQCYNQAQDETQVSGEESKHHAEEKSEVVVPTTEPQSSSLHKIIRPTAITLTNIKGPDLPSSNAPSTVADLGENLSSWTPFKTSGFISSSDDDFDDFKSATPTAVNVAINTPISDFAGEDDVFDDFKQAPIQIPHDTCIKEQNNHLKSSAIEQDLMSPEEDKYSVFRSLQHRDESSEWGDFSSDVLSTKDGCAKDNSVLVKDDLSSNVPLDYIGLPETVNNGKVDFFTMAHSNNSNSIQVDEDFGDFIHADIAAPSSIPAIAVEKDSFIPNFADFSNINYDSGGFHKPDFKQTCDIAESSSSAVEGDSEFGEFASSLPVTFKPEYSQEFIFHHVKDNISLAESQSVSSLELGTFDGGGHSGESKSSLSRQGSVPSLDLKGVGLEGTDNEDGFGELQSSSTITRTSKSPSPSKDLKGSDDKTVPNGSVGLLFQPASTLSFVDKYSVIRSEQVKEEDQHISDWIRCLQSSLTILHNAKKMFNQMSCSTVCNEVISTEEGENYVKNITEVYKVVCRIALASKSTGKQTDKLLTLLDEAHQAWNTICGFFAGSTLMPEESALDFSSGVLCSNADNNSKACGLCLLNVDSRSKAFDKEEDTLNLSYGGRNYHSTCANLWVNCVDPLLPALMLPQLL